ncbi:hypothetical protein [Nonomuraea sp. SBT364]|uniref:hypothetical protein n=1 Tax=Nonomuraea sp. SBT364 TaxID=1580530 RepID=UPI00066E8C41|nr:hypothetical protein [Nonomuraea sp. SBT364]
MVLFAALLAPAIFAGGLLAGELSQYRHKEDRGHKQEFKAFAPILVPPPPHPARQYVAAMPAPTPEVMDTPDQPAVQTVAVPEVDAPLQEETTPEPTEQPPASPPEERQQSDCPGEWVDTWLWELCREHERQPALSLAAGLASSY